MKTAQNTVPELRFPEFEGEWKEATLGSVSAKPDYGLNSAATFFDGVHKYIRITDIDEKTHCYVPSPLTSPDSIPDDSFSLKEGDIVFARTGASTGKSYLYKKEDGNLYFAGFLIRFHIMNAAPKFIFLQTVRSSFKKRVLIESVRSGQPGLNAQELSSFNLLIPCETEQQKIASFLTSIDDKLTKLRRKRELLNDFKRGLMQQLFSQTIRFKQDDGSEFPEWEDKTLKDLASRQTQKNNDDAISLVFTNSATIRSSKSARLF